MFFNPRLDRPSDVNFGSRRRAFSLIEFTVVLALIGLLAGIVTVNVRHHMVRGKQNAARGTMSSIATALESYYTIYGRYPTTDEGLAVLTQKTDEVPEPLLPRIPNDPWGRPYDYVQPGREQPYDVICLGADGRDGGTGADLDIFSSNLEAAPRTGGRQ